MGNTCGRQKPPFKDGTPVVILNFYGYSYWGGGYHLEALKALGLQEEEDPVDMYSEEVKKINHGGVEFDFMSGDGLGRCAVRPSLMSSFRNVNVLIYFVDHTMVKHHRFIFDLGVEELSAHRSLRDVRVIVVVTFHEEKETTTTTTTATAAAASPKSEGETEDSKLVEWAGATQLEDETEISKSDEENGRTSSKEETEESNSKDAGKTDNSNSVKEDKEVKTEEEAGGAESKDEAEDSKSNEEVMKDMKDIFKSCKQPCVLIACEGDTEATMTKVMAQTTRWIDEMNCPHRTKDGHQPKSLSVIAKMKQIAKTLPAKVLTR